MTALNRNWHCRVGRVTPKTGGATLRVLETRDTKEAREVDEYLDGLPNQIRRNFPDGIMAVVAVVWDGSGSGKSYYSVGNHSPIPWRLVPAYVHDRLSEEVNERNTREVINQVIDERFGLK